MNTFNTTYNFNQGNMNFGQALMYGAFGSLTGGMGCFGGGMGMMNPMGMGGSLFSMMGMGGFGYGCGGFGMSSFGMGGFGCGMSDSQYVGTLAGMMGSGLLIGGITKAIQNHKAAKAEAENNYSKLEEKIQTLTSEISELKTNNTRDKIAETLDSKFDTNITTAQSKYKKLENEQKTLNGGESETGSVKNLYKNYQDLKNKLDAGDTTVSQTDVDSAKAAYDLAVKRKAELDAKSGTDSVEAANNELEAAKKAKEDEITKIYKENEKVITQKNTELDTAKQELYKLQQNKDSKIFDKADGNSRTRMNDDDFENNFYENGELKINDNNKNKIDKSVIQAAANHLVNAKTEAERKRYSKEYIKLYDSWADTSSKKGSLEKAYDLAKKYQ